MQTYKMEHYGQEGKKQGGHDPNRPLFCRFLGAMKDYTRRVIIPKELVCDKLLSIFTNETCSLWLHMIEIMDGFIALEQHVLQANNVWPCQKMLECWVSAVPSGFLQVNQKITLLEQEQLGLDTTHSN
jgi:hypothetical protein